MLLSEKYGKTALVAGASEGLGAAWATGLAKQKFDLVLVARRKEVLETFAEQLRTEYGIRVWTVPCDLANENALDTIVEAIKPRTIDFMVYNAVLPYIGHFETKDIDEQVKMGQVNMLTPLKFAHYFGKQMLEKGKGGIVLMSSLAGYQGSGFLATYAATKAFNRILAESLWYEWKNRGVDVISCCAGATSTPNYINTQPASTGLLEPPVQKPEVVVQECLKVLGKKPNVITGTGNKLATFLMQRILPNKLRVNIMGDTTRKMYRIN